MEYIAYLLRAKQLELLTILSFHRDRAALKKITKTLEMVGAK